MESSRYLQIPAQEGTDKYTAAIELSNACRQFYKSRVEAANCIKRRWEQNPSCTQNTQNDNSTSASRICDNDGPVQNVTARKQRNSIDEAMEKLRSEMASLMDQDLSLMKQLLTLNETIEELKWQRRYRYSWQSVPGSSQELDQSNWSVSDTEMYDSDSDDRLTTNTTVLAPSATSPSRCTATIPASPCISTSRWRQGGITHSDKDSTVVNGDLSIRCVDTQILVNGSMIKVYHGEQNSFDSGIHEEDVSV